MKTIVIDPGDEVALMAVLHKAGFEEYAERIANAPSVLPAAWLRPRAEPYETLNGPSGLFDPFAACATGIIQDFAALKANGTSVDEVRTVGWFRAPDGHLCDASMYPEYLAKSV